MQQTQHLKRSQKYNMKKVYVGNLNRDVMINDLNKLFREHSWRIIWA